MKIRYAVVHFAPGEPPMVMFTSRFEWLAALVLRWWLPRLHGVLEILGLDLRPQALLNTMSSLQQTRDVLWQLVAKNDAGRWATVHDADQELIEADNDTLNRIFRHA